MGRIHEQYGALPFLGLVQAWLQLSFQELCLFLGVGLGRNGAYFAVAQVETFFKNRRTWVRPLLIPVSFSMAA
jgi:hypothetical protein